MTRNLVKNQKSKLILIIMLIGILCLSLFGVACNKSTKSDPPTYSYTETDDGVISNPNFSYGTIDSALTSFPKTSVTGWSRSKDSAADNNSSAKSGVINVSDDGWNELLNALYSDSAILNYLGTSKSKATEEIKEEKENDDYSPTSDEIKAHIIEKIKTNFSNPKTHEGAVDNNVYMLNNYLTESLQGKGTSQKITSATEVTLNKGEYAKVTVYLKTANLGGNSENGASIRLTNTFNGASQSEYAIVNINTNGEWEPYTIYVKADAQFATTIKVAVGLGYSRNYQTEGTVYIDDITVEHLESLTVTPTQTTYLDYNGEEIYDKITDAKDVDFDNDVLLYDMSLDTDGFFDYMFDYDFDVENTDKNTVEPPIANDDYHESVPVKYLQLYQSGYTATLTSNSFSLEQGEYAYVEFDVINKLNKLGNTTLTLNVIDKYDGTSVTRSAVTTITEVSEEWQKVGLVFKNNFEIGNARTFEIQLIIGPTDTSAVKYNYEYASGTVLISEPKFAKGDIELPDSPTPEQETKHDLFTLFSGTAKATTALYAGFSSDYTDSSDTETYPLTTSPSNIGRIVTAPASVSGYQGIVANHFYVKEETDGVTLEKDIDTRTGKGENGSFAGLINTKYLTTYESNIPGLKTALNFVSTDSEKNIQPLMIYNKTDDNYGFIGQSKTIAASSYAKISTTVRVVGDAKAYIYLVDVSNTEKSVMTFDAFTDLDGNPQSEKQLAFVVDASMMDVDTGWVTVEFYVATGATAKNFRVEVWNGSRDGATASQGFVFFKDINVSTSGAFSEPAKWTNTFTISGNPLYSVGKNNLDSLVLFKRALTDTEIKYNKEQTDAKKIVSYEENYVWAANDKMIYAVYNTIDPVEVDPYANETDEDVTSSGCTAETDPSTFWMSFSSILLAVALVLAIIMLFIKNVRRRRKANRSDAKSHYTVTSRVRNKKVKTSKVKVEEDDTDDSDVETDDDNLDSEVVEDNTDSESVDNENDSADQDNEEKTLDEYVYGDVEVFGEDEKKDTDKD